MSEDNDEAKQAAFRQGVQDVTEQFLADVRAALAKQNCVAVDLGAISPETGDFSMVITMTLNFKRIADQNGQSNFSLDNVSA